jgi:hypothetical protein
VIRCLISSIPASVRANLQFAIFIFQFASLPLSRLIHPVGVPSPFGRGINLQFSEPLAKWFEGLASIVADATGDLAVWPSPP